MPLPLQLENVSAGFAAVGPEARQLGARAQEAAAAALSAAIGKPVRISGVARPGRWAPRVGTSRLSIALGGGPPDVLLEVDARFAVRAVDLLAGGSGDVPAALALTPIETAALELLTLLALDAACSDPAIASLAPRLVRGEGVTSRDALVVDLELHAGPIRGNAVLVVPAATLRALEREGARRDLPARVAGWELEASLRRGTATLSAGELGALAVHDVVLLDAAAADDQLVLPGGLTLSGHAGDDEFTVTEVDMTEWNGDFPLALSVEIARATVTLGDLARLGGGGGVLPLHVGHEGGVTLRIGERAVARGRLVEVEGSLGVRIEAVEARP